MNLEDLGNIGEFVGAVGVVITLAYLAFQIRQNTNNLRGQAKHNATEQQLSYFDMLLGDRDLLRVYREGLRDLESLNPNDQYLFVLMMYKGFFVFSDAYYQYLHAHFDEEQWIESRAAVDWHISWKGCRQWWHLPTRRSFNNEFTDYVEDRLAQIDCSDG